MLALLLAAVALPAQAARQSHHPPLPLLDAAGRRVSESGEPLDTLVTCGTCHDQEYVLSHSFHALFRPADAASAGRQVATDCFACHLDAPALDQAAAAVEGGRPAWAATAALMGTALVDAADGTWTWTEALGSGRVSSAELPIVGADSESCGHCHRTVHTSREPLGMDELDLRRTATGEIMSWQRISASAVNVAGRESLGRPWDVHFERLVECSDCHRAVDLARARGQEPAPFHIGGVRVPFDADDWLARLAAGQLPDTPTLTDLLAGTQPPCETCHHAESLHDAVPYAHVHLGGVTCEGCHIPYVHAPGVAVDDRSLLDAHGHTAIRWRGLEGEPGDPLALVTGYRPTLLPEEQPDGLVKLAPYVLVTVVEWVDAAGAVVDEATLRQALFFRGGLLPDVVALLDENGDRALASGELLLDSADKVAYVRDRLEAVGVRSPRLQARVEPVPLHHGVGGKVWTARDCEHCHGSEGAFGADEVLGALPAGVEPALAPAPTVLLAGRVEGEGELVLAPRTQLAGIYVPGRTRWPWVDWLGGLVVLGSISGVGAHALRRRRS